MDYKSHQSSALRLKFLETNPLEIAKIFYFQRYFVVCRNDEFSDISNGFLKIRPYMKIYIPFMFLQLRSSNLFEMRRKSDVEAISNGAECLRKMRGKEKRSPIGQSPMACMDR
uniref:Uncharacterized protein n=1 Tax=Onchocerca volvulus TaxID=6282 RepID=A0A8R1XZN4_ONCVO